MCGNPQRIIWSGMDLVRVSDVPGFGDWLDMMGEDQPIVDDDDPTDWASKYNYDAFTHAIETVPLQRTKECGLTMEQKRSSQNIIRFLNMIR